MQMTVRYNYSDSELKKLLKTLVILMDTREQANGHIIQFLNSKKVSCINHKMDFGDYSAMIPANQEFGIVRDIYFDRQVIIERKNSLEELSQNLAQQRERFSNEFLRSKDCRKILLVEKGSYNDLIEGNYGTNFNANAYLASLLTFQHRYSLDIAFVNQQNAGKFIYSQLYCFVRNQLT